MRNRPPITVSGLTFKQGFAQTGMLSFVTQASRLALSERKVGENSAVIAGISGLEMPKSAISVRVTLRGPVRVRASQPRLCLSEPLVSFFALRPPAGDKDGLPGRSIDTVQVVLHGLQPPRPVAAGFRTRPRGRGICQGRSWRRQGRRRGDRRAGIYPESPGAAPHLHAPGRSGCSPGKGQHCRAGRARGYFGRALLASPGLSWPGLAWPGRAGGRGRGRRLLKTLHAAPLRPCSCSATGLCGLSLRPHTLRASQTAHAACRNILPCY
jgi:hypothetical protein